MNVLTTIDTENIRRYVSRKLLPVIGCANCLFTLTETELGVHNRVFYLDIHGYQPLVLKALAKRRRLRMLHACATHLAQHRIRAPRVIHTDEDAWLFGRRGFHVLCEERITGNTLFEITPSDDLVARVAQFFALMHRVTLPAWGTLDRLRHSGLFDYVVRRLHEKLAAWQAADPVFSDNAGARIRKWAQTWQAAVDAIATFSLSHGDPNPGNIMLTEAQELVLLDTGHLRYLPQAIDYYLVRTHMCRDNTERAKVFDRAYLAALPADRQVAFYETAPFFKLYVFVDFAALLATRLQKTLPGEQYYEEYRGSLAAVRTMIEDILVPCKSPT